MCLLNDSKHNSLLGGFLFGLFSRFSLDFVQMLLDGTKQNSNFVVEIESRNCMQFSEDIAKFRLFKFRDFFLNPKTESKFSYYNIFL